MTTGREPRVDPALKAVIGDAGRPVAIPNPTRDLDGLPGTRGRVVGLWGLFRFLVQGRDYVMQRVARYGPVQRHAFGLIEGVDIADPDLFLEVCRNGDETWSSALGWGVFFGGLDSATGSLDMPVALDFEPHDDVRTLFGPTFTPQALRGYLQVAAPVFDRVVDRWLRRGRAPFKRDVRPMFAEVSSAIFAGVGDRETASWLDRSLAAWWASAFAVVKDPRLSPAWRRGLRAQRELRERFRGDVKRRRTGDGVDLFSRMCQNDDRPAWIDDDALVRIFIGLMAAAFDTTSCAVTSMAYQLARHPEWQERLREECAGVTREQVLDGDLKQLEQLDWVWKETLRLHPVANSVPRRSLREATLGDYRIPANTQVFALITPLHLDPKWWRRPLTFDPERFSPDRAEDRQRRGIFVPFGAGAHTCIGMQLATLEAKAFWHAMLTRCRFRLARDYTAKHQYLPLGMVSGDVELTIESA